MPKLKLNYISSSSSSSSYISYLFSYYVWSSEFSLDESYSVVVVVASKPFPT